MINASSSTSVDDIDVVQRRRSDGSRSAKFRNALMQSARSRRRSSPSGLLSCDSVDGETHQMDLARSLSFKNSNDSDGFQSFCPSDLEFKELLGKGCFGEAYKVVNRHTGTIMVLKCLYRMDQKCESDFLQEAAFMRNLCHPNVLGILGILYKDKKLHIVTEYIPCGSLRACIDSNAKLTWLQRLAIAKDVSAGMSYLHNKRIIHRDLTSCNILLREKYSNAVVADFGLALMLSRHINNKKRCLPAGDPYVMAPEMIKEEPYDERADIFSFGITLCELIARCSVDPDILPRTKDYGVDRAAYLEKFASDCPEPFHEIAFKCASVDPQQRPPFCLLYDWISVLLAAVFTEDRAEFDEFIDDIRSFAHNTNEHMCDHETPPIRPSSSLGRLTMHKRKISLDLGYDSSLSPQRHVISLGSAPITGCGASSSVTDGLQKHSNNSCSDLNNTKMHNNNSHPFCNGNLPKSGHYSAMCNSSDESSADKLATVL